jgi:hypothetical protein
MGLRAYYSLSWRCDYVRLVSERTARAGDTSAAKSTFHEPHEVDLSDVGSENMSKEPRVGYSSRWVQLRVTDETPL